MYRVRLKIMSNTTSYLPYKSIYDRCHGIIPWSVNKRCPADHRSALRQPNDLWKRSSLPVIRETGLVYRVYNLCLHVRILVFGEFWQASDRKRGMGPGMLAVKYDPYLGSGVSRKWLSWSVMILRFYLKQLSPEISAKMFRVTAFKIIISYQTRKLVFPLCHMAKSPGHVPKSCDFQFECVLAASPDDSAKFWMISAERRHSSRPQSCADRRVSCNSVSQVGPRGVWTRARVAAGRGTRWRQEEGVGEGERGGGEVRFSGTLSRVHTPRWCIILISLTTTFDCKEAWYLHSYWYSV